MRITIISAQAIIAGREEIAWTGDVDLLWTDENIDERIFRKFNRVEDGDDWELSQLGYELPSLSVGDLIHYHENGATVRVAGQGFERIDADTLARAVMFG